MRLDFSVLTFCFISGFFFFQFFFISDIYFGISSGSTVTHSLRPVNLLFGLRVLLIKVLAGLRFYLVLAAEQGGGGGTLYCSCCGAFHKSSGLDDDGARLTETRDGAADCRLSWRWRMELETGAGDWRLETVN